MRNDIQSNLSKTQKHALMALARSMNMVHVGDGIHSFGLSRYMPTKYGWEPVVKYNWKNDYKELERKYDNLQAILKAREREIKELNEVLSVNKERKWLEKVLKYTDGRMTDKEAVKRVRQFLLDKKKGG